ncbi:MAG: hypothetical protein PHV06_06280, partial [bacterium]|nr:hypothetical protein [bacterium]
MSKRFALLARFTKYEFFIFISLAAIITVTLSFGNNFTEEQKRVVLIFGIIFGLALFAAFMVFGAFFLKPYEDFINKDDDHIRRSDNITDMTRGFLNLPMKFSLIGAGMIFAAFLIGIVLLIILTGLNHVAAIRLVLINAGICILYILVSLHLLSYFTQEYVRFLINFIDGDIQFPKLSLFKKIFLTLVVICLLVLFNIGVIAFTQAENVVFQQVTELLLKNLQEEALNYEGDLNALKPITWGVKGYSYFIDKEGNIVGKHLKEIKTIDEEDGMVDWIKTEILSKEDGIIEDFNTMKIYVFATIPGTEIKYISALYYLDDFAAKAISKFIISLLLFTL